MSTTIDMGLVYSPGPFPLVPILFKGGIAFNIAVYLIALLGLKEFLDMNETFSGRVWLLGDDIDTDIIIPTEYLALKTVQDMAPYAFSPLRPELASQIRPGDIIVAGKNFGCGSSREQAPEIIKALGVRCVVAKSFARIFFRNAINNGLLLIENADLLDAAAEGDTITVEMNRQIIHQGKAYPIASLPQNLMDIIEAGGLVKAMRRLNGLED